MVRFRSCGHFARSWDGGQVNPKVARMKGARNGLFFDIQTIKKQMFFHDAHIGNGSALWTCWHFTCVSSMHRRNPCGPGTCAHWDFQTPVHWPTPLSSFAKFRGRPSFATPLIGFGAHGARPHIHPEVTVGGPMGTRFAMAFMYSLSSANTSKLSSS